MLLTTLNFLDYTGSIVIDAIDIATLSPELLRSRIPAISQDIIELSDTVRLSLCPIAVNMTEEQNNRLTILITALLRDLGLWSTIQRNGGLNAMAGSMKLSHGQKQLMSIAHGILRQQLTRSKLVLLDEPTSSLDHKTDARVQKVFDRWLQNCTIITVAHRAQSILRAGTIYEISDGQVSARTDYDPNAGPRPSWNPDQHRYIGHAGPHESSDDGSRVLTTFHKHTVPFRMRREIQVRQLSARRDVEAGRAPLDANGRPMSPTTWCREKFLSKFHKL